MSQVKQTTPYYCRVPQAGNQSPAGATDFKIIHSGPTENIGGLWDTTNNRLVAPVAGLYHVSGHAIISAGIEGSRVQLNLAKNSVNVVRITDEALSGTGTQGFGGSAVVYLLPGDYLEIWGWSASPMTWLNNTIAGGTHFIGAKVG